ncbi:hypothetical protein F4802DRAFT_491428 [Xylaria palmicola]|nr:hypothetical protein F4802DRAFT_491428 [Xylaria palmicola]
MCTTSTLPRSGTVYQVRRMVPLSRRYQPYSSPTRALQSYLTPAAECGMSGSGSIEVPARPPRAPSLVPSPSGQHRTLGIPKVLGRQASQGRRYFRHPVCLPEAVPYPETMLQCLPTTRSLRYATGEPRWGLILHFRSTVDRRRVMFSPNCSSYTNTNPPSASWPWRILVNKEPSTQGGWIARHLLRLFPLYRSMTECPWPSLSAVRFCGTVLLAPRMLAVRLRRGDAAAQRAKSRTGQWMPASTICHM